jgi:deoxyribodipyrimidine photolyase-related protein
MPPSTTTSEKSLFVILGNQLFPPKYLKGHEKDLLFMAEDRNHCEAHAFHKHKIVFYLSAMRHYARELRQHDFNLVYFEMEETKGLTYEKVLTKVMKESALNKITAFEVEDKEQEKKLRDLCEKNGYELEFKKSPAFMVSREEFKTYLKKNPRPQFKTFYEEQRRTRKILMEPNGEPFGGRFIIDDEEHLKWSKKHSPRFPASVHDEIDMAVVQLVEKEFPENPGQAQTFWYPTSRESAQTTFKDFCSYRLPEYGPYEVALNPNEDFLFHSVLAPLLNAGLLVPDEVLQKVLSHAQENPVPLLSLESYIRHVFGWREYAHGVYQNFSEEQENGNFWQHHRLLNKNWRTGKTGVPPLDDAIHKANRLAYNHRVERMMVLCNMMNMAEIHPQEAYRWFSEMHMDSAPWATGPNVYGLGLQSDGGICAHQLYICSSKYWLKISSYSAQPWTEEVDGLYWRFIEKHQEFFNKNSKLYLMAKNLEKLTPERREVLWKAADAFLARNTLYP